VTIETPELDPSLIFEQDPVQILDALLPLYMNSCLLRSLQEALASELAARMNAMNSATDNARALRKVLLVKFNKQRARPRVMQEISEVGTDRQCDRVQIKGHHQLTGGAMDVQPFAAVETCTDTIGLFRHNMRYSRDTLFRMIDIMCIHISQCMPARPWGFHQCQDDDDDLPST